MIWYCARQQHTVLYQCLSLILWPLFRQLWMWLAWTRWHLLSRICCHAWHQSSRTGQCSSQIRLHPSQAIIAWLGRSLICDWLERHGIWSVIAWLGWGLICDWPERCGIWSDNTPDSTPLQPITDQTPPQSGNNISTSPDSSQSQIRLHPSHPSTEINNSQLCSHGGFWPVLLRSLCWLLAHRHEKVQENCIDLVGRIADRGAEHVGAREWMRICFELLELLKAHKKAIRRATVNTFGYIAKAIG